MLKHDASNARLLQIPVEAIDRNPENPRIFFRQGELETLQESIRQHGVQVPISVFQRGDHYILIDGERRWRCALKLNMKRIPALVQDEPDPLTNVLLMFNIHALREQWDLLTIAMKLPSVYEMLTAEMRRPPKEAEISNRTGLGRSVIRRCKLLIELPPRYREMLQAELKKPKTQQKLSEDFFIEMERSLRTVERTLPDLIQNKNAVRDVLINKYKSEVIKDLVDLRYIPKIAKAEQVHVSRATAVRALEKVFSLNSYSLQEAFEDTVAEGYSEKTLVSKVWAVVERLSDLEPESLDSDLSEALLALRKAIRELLGRVG
jgi:ParB family chromosome partitioning protein